MSTPTRRPLVETDIAPEVGVDSWSLENVGHFEGMASQLTVVIVIFTKLILENPHNRYINTITQIPVVSSA